MTYVLYTPPQHNDRSFFPGSSQAKRAVGRIWGPMRTGFTQFRIDGQWHQKAVPTTNESVAVDTDIDGTVLFLRGGHWHRIRQEIVDEITDAGLDTGDVVDLAALYPSAATFPSTSTIPGAA